jgi:PmbA protein
VKNQLKDLGVHVIQQAEKFGATQAEAYLESRQIIEVKMEKGCIRLASEKLDLGCGIRAIVGKQIGVSYVTSLLENDLEQAVQDSLKAANASVQDPELSSLATSYSKYPSVRGIFDKALAHLECEEAVDIMARSVQASREISGKTHNLVEGELTSSLVTRAIVNSLGINKTSLDTQVELSIYSSIGNGDDKCSSGDYQKTRTLAEINPELIGTTSAENALKLRGAKTIASGDMPLILTPRALRAVLGWGFTKALDARQVQDGKSYLVDSIGSEISSTELEIVDNALLPGAIGSRPFDGEGVPSQNTPIINSGILRNYLHDSYSSSKAHVENTGNAFRSSYRVTPSIKASNLIVTPGTATLEDMISDITQGVLCTDTLDSPNMVTGELSALVMEGFLIQRGEIKHALKNTLFNTTMQNLLKQTSWIGSDVESRGSVLSPSILIDTVKITSG